MPTLRYPKVDLSLFLSSLSLLKPQCKLEGFKFANKYLNNEGRTLGGRFVHVRSGMPLDLLYFNSLWQTSIYFNTYPKNDKGEAHVLEHIVLGKGKKGKYLNMLMDMSLGELTAATYPELTVYQFNTVANGKTFYALLEGVLSSLIFPDFSDLEAEREIYNLDAKFDSNSKKYSLEEKGTAYNEMLVAMEKPFSNNWQQLSKSLFGKGHPLAFNSGGSPGDMRDVNIADLRRFHFENYFIGPNMGMIISPNPKVGVKEVLKNVSGVIDSVGPIRTKGKANIKKLPPFLPSANKEIKIGTYPSGNENANEDVLFAWKPIRKLDIFDSVMLSVFFDILAGGESSLLHRDFVDRNTRKTDMEISSVGGYLDDAPSNVPLIFLSGISSDDIVSSKLKTLRDIMVSRIKWFGSLDKDRTELSKVNKKARVALISRAKTLLKFIDSTPHFGSRSGGVGWHKYLNALCEEKGFEHDMSLQSSVRKIIKRLDRNDNIWKTLISKFNLSELPYTSAVKPDKEILKSQVLAKQARLKQALAELKFKYKTEDEQSALKQFGEENNENISKVENDSEKIKFPKFIENPPLTLDENIRFCEKSFSTGDSVLLHDTQISPFIDVALYFDLNVLESDELIYVPLLSGLFSGLGVTLRDGTVLDYSQTIERIREDILALNAGISLNPEKNRTELAFVGLAESKNEIPKLFEWMENCLFRPRTDVKIKNRLIDMINEDISDLRNITSQREEYWVKDFLNSVLYQKNPLFMSAKSPYTILFFLERLRWRLEDMSAKKITEVEEIFADILLSPEDEKRLDRLSPEMARQIKWNLNNFPDNAKREKTKFLLKTILEDLKRDSSDEIECIRKTFKKVISKNNFRSVINANSENLDICFKNADEIINRLPTKPQGQTLQRLDKGVVLNNLQSRYLNIKTPVHFGFVNDNTNSGAFVVSSGGVSYEDLSEKDIIDFLSVKILSGGGTHSLFMKTWSAGLAYSNGIGNNLSSGRLSYYAERCSDLVETMQFVSKSASGFKANMPYLIGYALANSFNDYRGAQDMSSRGFSMGADLKDTLTPDKVKKFKQTLLKIAKKRTTLKKLDENFKGVLAKVLVGLDKKVSKNPQTVSLVIAPKRLLDSYEKYLRETGETDELVRIYPCDFWFV
jgi:Zn-dependent M16 (insulinase) family peptidase